MSKHHNVSQSNLELFLKLNEQFRHATAHSETQFFSQFKDISILQAHVILGINYLHPCNMSQIAKSSNLSLGGVTQLIDKLEGKKYLKRVRSKQDRRVIYIELTSRGKKVVRANEQHVMQVGEKMMRKFTLQEQKQFLNFFKRMAE